MSLRQLLGDAVPSFIDQFYTKLPHSQASGAAALCELGSWEVLAKALQAPQADTMVVRRNQRYDGPLPQSPDDAQRLVAEGYTLLVKHAERHDARLAALAAAFARDFATEVNIHMYCTPAEQYGFAWHYDAEEVFIVQTTGRKEYRLRKNTVNPWPIEETLPADMRYEREIMPLMQCELAAGDWLYIPSGYWHMGESRETAISLAIGVQPRTGVDVFDFLRPRIVESLLWRQRLPVVGDAQSEDAEARMAEVAKQLAQDISKQITSPEVVREFLRSLRQKCP